MKLTPHGTHAPGRRNRHASMIVRQLSPRAPGLTASASTPRLLVALALAFGVPVGPASAVVGGEPLPEESVRWFADLQGCGGTLVAPDRVLTAGHCVRGLSLSDLELIRVAGTVRRGVRFAMHPRWRRTNGGNVLEDIAVVQLDTPVPGVPPIALGGPLPEQVRIIGRGMFTAPDRHGWGEVDDQVRVGELRPITDSRCARAYRRDRGNDGERFHAKQMLCATDIDGRPPLSSPCYGDSGGPLYSGPESAPVLHGVVSWGGARSGAERLPSVYASVRRIRGFIAVRAPAWAPVPDGPAVISGRARPGRRLTCVVPSWSVPPTRIRVRWQRWADGPPDPAGKGTTYTVRRRDAGHVLGCSIKASNVGGLVSVAHAPASSVHVPRQR